MENIQKLLRIRKILLLLLALPLVLNVVVPQLGIKTKRVHAPPANSVFGKTSIGGNLSEVPLGYSFVDRLLAPEDGTVIGMSVYLRGRYTTGLVKALIYSDINGEVGSFLAESGEVALSLSWAWHNFTVEYVLDGGEYYWFGVFGSVELQTMFDSGLVDHHAYAWGWEYPTVPEDFGGIYGPTYASEETSIYVTYTPLEARFVSGVVTDNATGLPLVDVVVVANGFGPVYTLTNGTYTLRVGADVYNVTFSKAGYETAYTSVDTILGDLYGVDAALTPSEAESNTFGKTSVGETLAVVPYGYAFVDRLQAPEDGTATIISAYLRGRFTSGLVKAFIYSDRWCNVCMRGEVGTLILESETTLLTDWAWHNFTVEYVLDGGEYYWFGVFGSVELQTMFDSGLVDHHAYAWGWEYPTVPEDFGGIYGPTYASEETSIYVTYTPPDSVPPLITIISPQNMTYTASSIPLNFTVDEVTSWIGYSLDDQATVVIHGNTTLTNLMDGAHKIVVHANDTSNNTGFSDTIYFTVSLPLEIPIKDGLNSIIEGNVTLTNAFVTRTTLHFEASGPTGSTGWINVTFPMVNTTKIKIFLDGNKFTSPPFPSINTNGTHCFIYFEFTLSTRNVDIQYATADIAATNITTAKTVVGHGYTIHINTTIQNRGDYEENLNVTIYVNTTEIGKQTIILTSGDSTTITFPWNTQGFEKGNYTLCAYAEPVPDETDTSDNTFVEGWVLITIPGDVDGDRDVDVGDMRKVQNAMFSKIGDSNYDPNADVDCDEDVDVGDMRKQQLHVFEEW